MSLETALEHYPKKLTLKDGFTCEARPLRKTDQQAFFDFFQAVPERERMFIKHRVSEPAVIQQWCQNIDLGRNLPLLAVAGCKILADCTLHQQLGGWKRHIGRVSILVHKDYRNRGLARALLAEIIEIARQCGLERLEAEFIGEQERAMKVFSLAGFTQLLRLEDYVKDMQAIPHDYILMGMELLTDEEYAGMG
jgi:GNAT superfamily N-acetyltransferase